MAFHIHSHKPQFDLSTIIFVFTFVLGASGLITLVYNVSTHLMVGDYKTIHRPSAAKPGKVTNVQGSGDGAGISGDGVGISGDGVGISGDAASLGAADSAAVDDSDLGNGDGSGEGPRVQKPPRSPKPQ